MESTPRERRGERKLARAAATKARHQAFEALQRKLAVPPNTSEEAAERWDQFYKTKQALFKDRHLLRAEFPEMMSDSVRTNPSTHVPPLQPLRELRERDLECDLTMLEVGCGVGNGVFPVLRANRRIYALAFDYSIRAIHVMKKHDEYRTDRVKAFQADLAEPETYVKLIQNEVKTGVDFVTALWTLSALPPGIQQDQAAEGVATVMKPGGLLFLRDYAHGDMREEKFTKSGRKLQDKLYLRGDGTYAYFFDALELKLLFEKVGLITEVCQVVEREVHNRKAVVCMKRRWIHAKFRKPG